MNYKIGEPIPKVENQYGRRLNSAFLIAKLGQAHGLYGGIKFQFLGNEHLLKNKKCLLLDAQKNFVKEVVASVHGKDKTAYLSLADVSNRNEAEKLRHYYLALERAKLPALEADAYFVEDLLNCVVQDENLGQIGFVSEIMQHTSQDVYQVDRSKLGKKPLLFVDDGQTIKQIDVDRGIIEVKLPEGLWEIYEN